MDRRMCAPGCSRHGGVVDPAPYMWQRAILDRRITVARDLGPDVNDLLAPHPAAAFALVRGADGAAALLPYDEAMEKLWGRHNP